MKELQTALIDKIKNLMDNKSAEQQIVIMRMMICAFSGVAKEKNLPIMTDIVVQAMIANYPHLKNDMDKLLILM